MNFKKWQKLSLTEQIGNIGSEVNRMFYWEERKDKEGRKQAFLNALELIDLTISDKRWRFRLSEVCRLREVICDFFIGSNFYKISKKSLKNYFLPFALLRNKKTS